MNWQLPYMFGIFNWRDGIEIIFFSSLIYTISLWLKKDTQKNLLPYFYGFCLLAIGTHFFALSTISQCLFIFSPSIIVLFMFTHQSTLQRNLIALKNLSHSPVIQPDWLTLLTRCCLTLFHTNKEVLLLLEHTDAMEPFLKVDYTINAPFSQDLFSLIMEKTYIPQKMIWLRSNGIIRGVNVSWKASWHPDSYEHSDAWVDDAIAYTSKNDVLLLHINPKKQYYSLAYNGFLHHDLTIEQVSQLIRQKINYDVVGITKKGKSNDIAIKKNNVAQHTP